MLFDMHHYGLVVVDIVCCVLAYTFVAVHIWGRYRVFNGLITADYLLLASLVFYPQLIHCDWNLCRGGWFVESITYMIHRSNSPVPQLENYLVEEELILGLKLTYAFMPPYHACVLCVKTAFLLMYRQIIPTFMKRLRITVDAALVIVVLGYSVIILMHLFWCLPISSNWATKWQNRCVAMSGVPNYLFSTLFHIGSDVVIYIIPFFLIPSLLESPNHEKRKRSIAGVIGMFSMGFLCILIAVARIVITVTGAFGAAGMGAFLVAEVAAPQVLFCLPTIRRLLNSTFASKNNSVIQAVMVKPTFKEIVQTISCSSKDDQSGTGCTVAHV